MISKLMYVFDDRELAEKRVGLLEGLGLETIPVKNAVSRTEGDMETLLDFVFSGLCSGMWVDIPTLDLDPNIDRLIKTAEATGKCLLGQIAANDVDVVGQIMASFGALPANQAVTQ